MTLYIFSLLNQVIYHISKSQRTKSDQSRTWRLSFRPSNPIELRELDSEEVTEVANGEDRVGFLPWSYFETLQ